MSYALYAIRQQMNSLEFDKSCVFISEDQYQRERAALRRKAAREREEELSFRKHVNPHEAKRVGKALLGCVLAFHLLTPFTPVGEIRDTFAIEPLPWFVAMLIVSLPLCYIPALLLAAWTRKPE
jgi:hypothetical protein